MLSKWRVLGPLALVATGLIAGGGIAAAQTSSQPQPTHQEVAAQAKNFAHPLSESPKLAKAMASATAASTKGGDGGLGAAALPAGLCYAAGYHDANEAGDTLLDATSYALGHECENSVWLVDVVTVDNWNTANMDWFDISIDVDNNVSNGCEGGDYRYVVFGDLTGGGIRTPSCDTNTWAGLPDAVAFSHVDGTNHATLGFQTGRFAPVHTLRWQSTIAHANLSDPIDYMPDGLMTRNHYKTAPGNPCGGHCFFLKNSFTGGPADTFFFDSRPATQYLIGDWNSDGFDSLGFRNGASFQLKDVWANPGTTDYAFTYGTASDKVLVGDWDGTGSDTLALRRGNTYYIKNSLGGGSADQVVSYGRATDVVLVGDWDGNGTATLAVRRGNTYYIKNTISGGPADQVVSYGRATDAVLVGDWNGDGTDSLAVRRGNTYYIKNTISGGPADTVVSYGKTNDVTLVGDWDNDHIDTLAVRR